MSTGSATTQASIFPDTRLPTSDDRVAAARLGAFSQVQADAAIVEALWPGGHTFAATGRLYYNIPEGL